MIRLNVAMRFVPSVVCLVAALWLSHAHAERSANEWYVYGMQRVRARDAGGAFDALSRAVTLDPGHSEAREWLVGLAAESGRAREALPLLARAVKQRPKDSGIARGLSNLHLQLGDFENGVEWRRRSALLTSDGEAKWEELYQFGTLVLRALRERPDMAGAERARIAGEGIAAVEVVAGRWKDPMAAHFILSHLHTARARAQRSVAARDADLATAQRNFQLATGTANKP